MRCIKCNEEIEIDDNFCPRCGNCTPHGYLYFKNDKNKILPKDENIGSLFALVALLIITFVSMMLISGKDMFKPYIEIKKEIAPKNPTKNFNVLNKYKHEIKTGLVIDCAEKLRPLNDISWCLPVYMLGL